MSDHCCHTAHDEHENPVLLDTLGPVQSVGAELRTPMRILKMDCPSEEAMIRKRLHGMAEVQAIDFNLIQRVLTVQHTADGLDAIVGALRSIGFEPQLPTEDGRLAPIDSQAQSNKPWWPLALAGVAALGAELVHWWQASPWLGMTLAVLAIALSGLSTYRKGLTAIVNRNLNINALMSIAVTGAILLGQWPEAAMVMVLFAIAEAIEARSLDHARRSVERLMDVAPEMVHIQDDNGRWHDVLASSVAVGTRVRVRPGERIGLDGIVTSGSSEVNQAPITGESAMQPKTVGDTIYAGAINGMGELEYRVSAASDNTMLARIIHAVQEAQSRQAPMQRFVDRFAQVYTPVVCVLALMIAVVPPLILDASWYEWIYRALVLLVIACPCALVISTPVAVVSALGAAARHGILVKGGVYLEQGRHLQWLAFDKTGTLTVGKPVLLDAVALQQDMAVDQCRQIAASLARRSDHPVSKAIVQAVHTPETLAASPDVVQEFQAIPGCGVQARLDGQWYYLGNYDWVLSLVQDAATGRQYAETVATWQSQGKTVTALASGQMVLALFAVADSLRDSTVQAIQDLHELGVRTMMLSGDNAAVANYIGQQVGIDKVHAQLLPHEKLAAIEQAMQDGKTGMVGDGINDAPALARADIGFAMGVMGTDTAIETADVALMDDDLRKLVDFISLSRRTHRILVQNISVALGIKAVFLVVTLLGLATMWMAVFADVGASLIVLANSLRLLRR